MEKAFVKIVKVCEILLEVVNWSDCYLYRFGCLMKPFLASSSAYDATFYLRNASIDSAKSGGKKNVSNVP